MKSNAYVRVPSMGKLIITQYLVQQGFYENIQVFFTEYLIQIVKKTSNFDNMAYATVSNTNTPSPNLGSSKLGLGIFHKTQMKTI